MNFNRLMRYNKFIKELQNLEKELGVKVENLADMQFHVNGKTTVAEINEAVKKEKPTLVVKTRKVRRALYSRDMRVPVNGERVRKLLKEQKKSISKLGREINIGHESLLSHYLSARHDPNEVYFVKLAKALNVEPQEIVGSHYSSSGKPYEGKYAKRSETGKVIRKRKIQKKYLKKKK